MNNPLFIARKDHEVYFVKLSGRECRFRAKAIARAEIALRELHPGFSESNAFDALAFRVGAARWLMITVMRRVDLDEYRTLHPFRPLVTVSSALTSGSRFAESPVARYGDEIVGYSAELDMPVSVPVADDASRARYAEATIPRVRRVHRSEVFANSTIVAVRRAALCAAIVLASLAVSSFVSAASETRADRRTAAIPSDAAVASIAPVSSPEKLSIPDMLSVLVDISGAVISAGGTLDSFSYGETARDPLSINVHGCEVLSMKNEMRKIPYLVPGVTGLVEYRDGCPYFSLTAEVDDVSYSVPVVGAELSADAFFSFAPDARAKSASLVSGGVGRVSYKVASGDLPDFLGEIAEKTAKDRLRVSGISVVADRKLRSFRIDCSVTAGSPVRDRSSPDNFNDVLAATRMMAANSNPFKSDDSTRVGSITGMNGHRLSFYRNDDGIITGMGE